MKRNLLSLGFLLAFSSVVFCQSRDDIFYNPGFALKTNLLYWATTTPNLGMEIGLSKRTTLDISGGYNPWTFSDNKKIKHWLVQPELRYWFCERFNGHFMGLHGHAGQFNICGIDAFGLDKYRYEGDFYGAGLSYGYQWILGKHWSIEATVGVGWAYIDYEKYNCDKCSPLLKSDHKNYFGPTKLGINLIYIIK